jgi:hypothetical protein
MMRMSPARALEFKSALVEDSTLRSLALHQKSHWWEFRGSAEAPGSSPGENPNVNHH